MLQDSFARPLLAFRLIGVPVSVEVTFLITTFLLAGSRRESASSFGLWLGVVFVSVLSHELGHALAGRRFGLSPAVRLYGWGGLTHFTSGPSPGPWRRVAISVAGPFTNIATGAACLLAKQAVPLDAWVVQRVLDDFVWTAGFWGFVNLVPLLPLDGGHVCEALLTRFAPAHELQGARVVSTVTGLAVGAAALHQRWILGAAAAFWLGADSARALVSSHRRRRDDALRERVWPLLRTAIAARDGDAVVALAREHLPAARTEETRAFFHEQLAIGHALRGAYPEVAAALASMPRSGPASARIEGFIVELAVRQKRRALAAAAGADPDVWEGAPAPGDDDEPWEAACELLRGARSADVDAVAFARAREAAAVLRREADAATLGEGLFEKAPDPDLAFALACAWAGAQWATKAVALGFRDWERALEALAGKGGERARRALERAHDGAG
jgi:Zn-dependent protease